MYTINLPSKSLIALTILILIFFTMELPGGGHIGLIYSHAAQHCEGNLDDDTDVDNSDLAVFVRHFGRTNCNQEPQCTGDLDNEGDVDGLDLAKLAAEFGQTDCTPVELPPDPADVASEIDLTVATGFFEATEFLYTGDNPIQRGMLPDTIEENRAAVLRGMVLDRNGLPLPRVIISILNHSEYGITLSREDGMFDLAVNGGGLLTVNYAKAGYLPAQRHIQSPWHDYVWLPDVVMIPLDNQVTTVNLTSPADMQLAQGSVVTDNDGSRQAMVLFPLGTTAEMVFEDGSTQPTSVLNVRATEYTVGENGPEAMPALLPPTSGYTYAVELSADEAIAAGAETVKFNQPVIFYVDNFLDYTVGINVPVGIYDSRVGAWKAVPDGRIIEIVSITGVEADLDMDGDGDHDADDESLETEWGITQPERVRLAELYSAGESLWRVTLTHFTPVDCNFTPICDADPEHLFDEPSVCKMPDQPEPEEDDPDENSCESEGSIIECQNQVLGQRIPITGSPFTINYRSSRVSGNTVGRTLDFQITSPNPDLVPLKLQGMALYIVIAGRRFEWQWDHSVGKMHHFEWDGIDAYGRKVQGTTSASGMIGYLYANSRSGPQAEIAGSSSFGLAGFFDGEGDWMREYIGTWQYFEKFLTTWDEKARGLGGWSLSVHHAYDYNGGYLFMGDGRVRKAQQLGMVMRDRAGDTSINDYAGDGYPATEVSLNGPEDVAVGEDGTLYITSWSYGRVLKVSPDGIMTTLAGTGTGGYSGDGGPAVDAELYFPRAVAVGPDGSVYIADNNYGGTSDAGSYIRRVTPDGIIDRFAGAPYALYPPYGDLRDGHLALDAPLNRISDIIVAPDSTVFVVTAASSGLVRRIGPDGIINTYAGGGNQHEDGVPAWEYYLGGANGIALAPDGTLYISASAKIHRVSPDGIISTVAGTGTAGFFGDGGYALVAQLSSPFGMALDSNGLLHIVDRNNRRVRVLDPEGIINTVAGGGPSSVLGEDDGWPARQGFLFDPKGLAIGPDDKIYVADRLGNLVRSVEPVSQKIVQGENFVPSADGGALYVFDYNGRHLRTLDAMTNVTLYEFGYDSSGFLATVTDVDGLVTTVERGMDGKPEAIVGPYGQRTALTLNTNGYLETITNPASQTTRASYTQDGLLTRLVNPRDYSSYYSYDAQGRLERAEDPAGGYQVFTRSDDDSGYEVTKTSAMDRTHRYTLEHLSTGDLHRVHTYPNGVQNEDLEVSNGTRTATFGDGSMVTEVAGPDPRWGMLAPMDKSITLAYPSGLEFVAQAERSVTLTDPHDPLSLESSTATVTVNGRVYATTFNRALREYLTVSPEGRETRGHLNALGRLVDFQMGDLAPVFLTYDTDGRLNTLTFGEGGTARTFTYNYNNAGMVESILDPLSRSLQFGYDSAQRVTALTLPGNRTVAYGYDANGSITSLTPPGRSAHSFGYSARNQFETYSPPDLGAGEGHVSAGYNLDKQRTAMVFAGGDTASYNYDSTSGLLSSITVPEGQHAVDFDPDTGKLVSVSTPDAITLGLTYDGGLLTAMNWNGAVNGSIEKAFNNDLVIHEETVNASVPIAYGYDNDGLLTSAGALTLTRNPVNGLIIGTALADVSTSLNYDAFGDFTGISAAFNATPLYAVSYTRDQIGRITEKNETIGGETHTWNYHYDAAGRMTEVQKDNLTFTTYTYDANGNRLSYAGPLVSYNASYDAQDRLIQSDSATYVYNAAGHLKSITQGSNVTSYSYDTMVNLKAVLLPDGPDVTYLVDGAGRRMVKRINGSVAQKFLYRDRLNPIAQLDAGDTVVSRFVYASKPHVPDYMIRGGETYRLISDHLGSVRLVVNARTGEVAQRIDYDAFGNVLFVSGPPDFQPFGFAGGLYDPDTGLVHFGARDYDPVTGRWMTKDPIGFTGGTSNLYAYVTNNPINWTDPSGLRVPICKNRVQDIGRLTIEEIAEQMENMDGEDPAYDEYEDELMRKFWERWANKPIAPFSKSPWAWAVFAAEFLRGEHGWLTGFAPQLEEMGVKLGQAPTFDPSNIFGLNKTNKLNPLDALDYIQLAGETSEGQGGMMGATSRLLPDD